MTSVLHASSYPLITTMICSMEYWLSRIWCWHAHALWRKPWHSQSQRLWGWHPGTDWMYGVRATSNTSSNIQFLFRKFSRKFRIYYLGGRRPASETSPEGHCKRACCRGGQSIGNFGMSARLKEAGNHCSEKESPECQGLAGLPGGLMFFSVIKRSSDFLAAKIQSVAALCLGTLVHKCMSISQSLKANQP